MTTALTLLPTYGSNDDIFLLEDVFFVEGKLYNIADIEIADIGFETKHDVILASKGKIGSTDKTLIQQSHDLTRFLEHYLYHVVKTEPKGSPKIEPLRSIIVEYNKHSLAGLYAYYFQADDTLRQIVIDSNNASSAYFWCSHIENEPAMREIIKNSDDMDIIISYSLLLDGEDKEIEALILNDNTDHSYIDYYLDMLE